MSDQDILKTALKEIADESWAAEAQPVLLSNVPSKLQEKIKDDDYKRLLGSSSMKSFIKATGQEAGYKLIEHTTKSAKVALAPLDAAFEFDDVSPLSATSHKNPSKSATLAFLKALETLSEEDREKVNIPVSVLMKLLQ